MNSNVRKQYLKFNDLRRKYKFATDKEQRRTLQNKLLNLQLYSDMALQLNTDLSEDEKYLLKLMGKINIGRPND